MIGLVITYWTKLNIKINCLQTFILPQSRFHFYHLNSFPDLPMLVYSITGFIGSIKHYNLLYNHYGHAGKIGGHWNNKCKAPKLINVSLLANTQCQEVRYQILHNAYCLDWSKCKSESKNKISVWTKAEHIF